METHGKKTMGTAACQELHKKSMITIERQRLLKLAEVRW
jgi:hypothetical protein